MHPNLAFFAVTSTPNPADIPEGFHPVSIGGPFMAHNGPLFA